jgi:hypothetical protein
MLFDFLVVRQLLYVGEDEGEDVPTPALRVVPDERSLILIRRLSGQGEAGYWDQEKVSVSHVQRKNLGPEDWVSRVAAQFGFGNTVRNPRRGTASKTRKKRLIPFPAQITAGEMHCRHRGPVTSGKLQTRLVVAF